MRTSSTHLPRHIVEVCTLIGSVFGSESNRATLVVWTNETGLGASARVKTYSKNNVTRSTSQNTIVVTRDKLRTNALVINIGRLCKCPSTSGRAGRRIRLWRNKTVMTIISLLLAKFRANLGDATPSY